MVKILLLQGANLTFLGRREPEIYGSTTPAELDAVLRCHAHDHAYQLEIFYRAIVLVHVVEAALQQGA
jgi:3-dehydroquinate dehydratase II